MRRRPTDDADCEALGQTLRDLRHAAGLTQEKLGFHADLTKNYVSDLEAGTRNPTFLALNRLLAALGVTWEAFGAAVDITRHQARKKRRS